MTPPIFEMARRSGTEALHRGVLGFAGAALASAAGLFAAAALTVGLLDVMPLYAALLCGALALLLAAALCLHLATRERRAQRQAATDPAPAPVRPFQTQDIAWGLLQAEMQAHPGKTAAAAVVAGLMLGALEALEKRDGGEETNG